MAVDDDKPGWETSSCWQCFVVKTSKAQYTMAVTPTKASPVEINQGIADPVHLGSPNRH